MSQSGPRLRQNLIDGPLHRDDACMRATDREKGQYRTAFWRARGNILSDPSQPLGAFKHKARPQSYPSAQMAPSFHRSAEVSAARRSDDFSLLVDEGSAEKRALDAAAEFLALEGRVSLAGL
jgi:hypothetical protein